MGRPEINALLQEAGMARRSPRDGSIRRKTAGAARYMTMYKPLIATVNVARAEPV